MISPCLSLRMMVFNLLRLPWYMFITFGCCTPIHERYATPPPPQPTPPKNLSVWRKHRVSRIVQGDSGSDSDSDSRRKQCPSFKSVGACSVGGLREVDADSRNQTVYRKYFLILVSYSVAHRDAVTISSVMHLLFKLTYFL